jgi:hypothetical protein
MKTTHQVLVDAKELIKDPKNWWGKERPLRWKGQNCMYLALRQADNIPYTASESAIDAVVSVIPQSVRKGRSRLDIIANYNDTHVHRSCMKVMDRAITATAPR